jgi:hypothetical protein
VKSPGRLLPARAAPLGLVGMFVLVALTECMVQRHEIDFVHMLFWDWKDNRGLAARVAPGCEILCFGDSQVKLGVIPQVFEARLRRPAYNLAVLAATPPSAYYQLKKSLAAGATPTAIVVNYKIDKLPLSPGVQHREWPELLSLWECWEIAAATSKPSVLASVTLGWLLPSYRGRRDIRAQLLRTLDGKKNELPVTSQAYRRNWRLNRGALVASREPLKRDTEVLPNLVYEPNYWRCDSANAQYVRGFLQLAAARQIPVFWIIPPVSPATQRVGELRGFDERYTALVCWLASQFPNLTVIDGRHADYPLAAFCDPIHLNRLGAETLSVSLAEIIGHSLRDGSQASRWLTLPAYRPATTGLTMEDFQQSLAVTGKLDQTRR